MSNMYLSEALVTYLVKTDLSDVSGDAFILITNIFDESYVKSAKPEFIEKLINSMPHIVDVGTLDALVSILVVCLPYYM